MPPFIYINGYPGVGKFTIAKELCKLIPDSKVFDNHLIIDPVAAIFERTADEYQPLRRVLRQSVLKAIATSASTKDVTWIFTDQKCSAPIGRDAVKDYQDAAIERGSKIISIILHCDLEENMKRAMTEQRGLGNTKLMDMEILRMIRETEDLYRFNDENEIEIDVTDMTPEEAARLIFGHVCKVA